jgi:hypothetical protein
VERRVRSVEDMDCVTELPGSMRTKADKKTGRSFRAAG